MEASYRKRGLQESQMKTEGKKQSFADVLENKVLKNVTNFTEKHLCWSLFIINYRTPLVAASGRGL